MNHEMFSSNSNYNSWHRISHQGVSHPPLLEEAENLLYLSLFEEIWKLMILKSFRRIPSSLFIFATQIEWNKSQCQKHLRGSLFSLDTVAGSLVVRTFVHSWYFRKFFWSGTTILNYSNYHKGTRWRLHHKWASGHEWGSHPWQM